MDNHPIRRDTLLMTTQSLVRGRSAAAVERAPFDEHDMVRLLRPVVQNGRIWPIGTEGAIVHLGPVAQGCIVEVGDNMDGLLDVGYQDLEAAGHP